MQNANETTFIYGLADPTTHEVRYVGKSNHPNIRYKSHIVDTKKSHKRNWIKSLMAFNLMPILIILEEVSMLKWQEKEKFYILQHKIFDGRLVNGTNGGDGVQLFGIDNGFYGKKHSEESKQKMADEAKLRIRELNPFYDKAHTKESIDKMKAKHALRDDQWKSKQRESHLGRKDSENAHENKSKAQFGQSNSNAKNWTLQSPTGELIRIKSLKTWCSENSITIGKIHSNTKRKVINDWIIIL